MKKIFLLTITTLCFLHIARSQDGKIIEQTEYNNNDSVIAMVESIIPGIRADAEKTRFYRITYLSDGLKVKGYLATPKQAGKYPCIIYMAARYLSERLFFPSLRAHNTKLH